MLSQFSHEGSYKALSDLSYQFPDDVYPVGRLDADSEGLLILTNDKSLNNKLLHPSKQHWRTYEAQVEGSFSNEAKVKLEKGVEINCSGVPYLTRPSKIVMLNNETVGWDRFPPIRFRKNIPTSWIQISLVEGKNRQVRNMSAKVGFPTLRLIRISIGNLTLTTLKPGDVKEMTPNELFKLLLI